MRNLAELLSAPKATKGGLGAWSTRLLRGQCSTTAALLPSDVAQVAMLLRRCAYASSLSTASTPPASQA